MKAAAVTQSVPDEALGFPLFCCGGLDVGPGALAPEDECGDQGDEVGGGGGHVVSPGGRCHAIATKQKAPTA